MSLPLCPHSPALLRPHPLPQISLQPHLCSVFPSPYISRFSFPFAGSSVSPLPCQLWWCEGSVLSAPHSRTFAGQTIYSLRATFLGRSWPPFSLSPLSSLWPPDPFLLRFTHLRDSPLPSQSPGQSWVLPLPAPSYPYVTWPLPVSSISSPSILSLPHSSPVRGKHVFKVGAVSMFVYSSE